MKVKEVLFIEVSVSQVSVSRNTDVKDRICIGCRRISKEVLLLIVGSLTVKREVYELEIWVEPFSNLY